MNYKLEAHSHGGKERKEEEEEEEMERWLQLVGAKILGSYGELWES